jgi:hypothetical protein
MSKSAAAEVLREAEQAGSDAAHEAHAEVLERAAAEARSKRPGALIEGEAAEVGPATNDNAKAKSKSKGKAKANDRYARFNVDVWITDLNATEFGIYKHTRNKAKSRQFTSDMDIFAEIIEDGERTGLIGYREDLWKKNTGFDKRLVFKLFGENLNWRATMDLMLGRSVEKTVGARGLPVVSYSVNTNDHDQIVYVERSANKWPLMPEHFSFFLMDEGRLKFYRLKKDIIALGQDYSVYDGTGHKIGVLDGKLLTIGGFWKCKIRKEHADKRLLTVLKLFVGMLSFNKACRKHVSKLSDAIVAGRTVPKIEKQEADLYMNPRRVR